MDEKKLHWEKLDSRYVYDDRWFRARADTCRFPDGRIITPYYVVELPDWCNSIVVTEDEKIVMVRQYRYPVDQVTYELPGGIIEKGEQPVEAAKREVAEETGYQAKETELLMTLRPNPAINDNTAYFFLATGARPIVSTNPDAFEEVYTELFSKAEILQLLRENRMQHACMVGPMYQALWKLGWLTEPM